jgi:hypothetical protein
MGDRGERIQQFARDMYLRSPNSGIATAIHFNPIRRTFHSLTNMFYSGYARTALSNLYKSWATLSSIPHSLPPLLSSLLHFSLPRPSLPISFVADAALVRGKSLSFLPILNVLLTISTEHVVAVSIAVKGHTPIVFSRSLQRRQHVA